MQAQHKSAASVKASNKTAEERKAGGGRQEKSGVEGVSVTTHIPCVHYVLKSWSHSLTSQRLQNLQSCFQWRFTVST